MSGLEDFADEFAFLLGILAFLANASSNEVTAFDLNVTLLISLGPFTGRLQNASSDFARPFALLVDRSAFLSITELLPSAAPFSGRHCICVSSLVTCLLWNSSNYWSFVSTFLCNFAFLSRTRFLGFATE